jgi:hypothetical protein
LVRDLSLAKLVRIGETRLRRVLDDFSALDDIALPKPIDVTDRFVSKDLI